MNEVIIGTQNMGLNGREAWKKAKGRLDDEAMNKIVFRIPAGLNVTASFWKEFFAELRKSFSAGDLRNMFCSDEKSLGVIS